MLKYKNVSRFVKTVQGVTLNPGEIKEIHGNVNDPSLETVFNDAPEKLSQDSASSNTQTAQSEPERTRGRRTSKSNIQEVEE